MMLFQILSLKNFYFEEANQLRIKDISMEASLKS
jgi:hypothetical protein